MTFSSSAEALQKGLDDLYQFCKEWNFTVNETKTKQQFLDQEKHTK